MSKGPLKKKDDESTEPVETLLQDLRKLIASARKRVARQINEELVTLY